MGQVAISAAALVLILAMAVAPFRERAGRVLLRLGVVLVWLAVIVAVAALVRTDTSYALVADHTRPGLSTARRVMGLWGGSEGSLLAYVAIVGAVLAIAPTGHRGLRWTCWLIGPVVTAVAWVATPFSTLDVPAVAGSGLSPILEHWAMLIHPPLLYLGTSLALVPAVITGPSRRWADAALGTLTAALALGGGWAYVELGWGGWWAWDPVENAALVPWLLLVAHLHVPAGSRLAAWSSLALWPIVIGGAALTRTSLRTSVHAFADADSLGWVLWPLTGLAAAAALLHAVRHPPGPAVPWPRATPAALLIAAATVVALGTWRPFLPGDATDGWFYARFLYPVAVLGAVAIGVLPRWRRSRPGRIAVEAASGAVVGGVAAFVVGASVPALGLASAVGAGMASTIAAGTRPWRRTAAHLGILLVLVGAVGGTASSTRTIELAPGGTAEVAGRSITNLDVRLIDDDPAVIEAVVDVDGVRLRPRLSIHPDRGLRLPEVATRRRLLDDTQVVLRWADGDGAILITVNEEPLTSAVWLGAVLLTVAFYWPRRSRRARSSSLTVAADAGAGSGSGSLSGTSSMASSPPPRSS